MKAVQQFSYRNDTSIELRITLEPWADQYVIQPSQLVDIVVRSEAPGTVEFAQQSTGLIVYGYTGCTIYIYCDGVELQQAPQI